MDSSSSQRDDVAKALAGPGEESAKAEVLLPIVYEQLRALAERQLEGRSESHTLGATGLVNEVCLRLLGSEADWESQAHLLAVGATALRQVMASYAREKNAEKRGGGSGRARVTLSGLAAEESEGTADVAGVLESLGQLAEFDERQARIVELRYLAGMTLEQVAHVMKLSRATVGRECRAGRAWMRAALDEGPF